MRTGLARVITLLAICVGIASCGGGGAAVSSPPATPPAGRVDAFAVLSANTSFNYPVTVYVPQSYLSGTASLPVIYAVEGDAQFGFDDSSTTTRFEAFADAMRRHGTQAILVGIGGTARRNTDFLMPGAPHYLDFIVGELAPRIDAQYRTNPQRRALSGLSHGGYFVLAALFLEGSAGAIHFSHYLSTEASNGGTSDSEFFALEQGMANAARPVNTTALLAAGAPGVSTNNALVNAMYDRMAAHRYEGLALAKVEFSTTHVGTDVPAFEEALARYFP